MFKKDYFKVNQDGVSPFQNMAAYLGGSAFQTVMDNPYVHRSSLSYL